MTAFNIKWIFPLTALTITALGFAILAYSFFYRQIQSKINIICSTFAIPFITTVYAFVCYKGLPFHHSVVLSEVCMLLLLIFIAGILKYRISYGSALFLNIVAAIALCASLSYVHILPEHYRQLQNYLMLGIAMSCFYILLSRKSELSKFSYGFFLLGLAQFCELFPRYAGPNIAALMLRSCFYVYIVCYLLKHLHERLMKEVYEARQIKREFEDTLRKEVKKQTFYMELSQEKMAKAAQTDNLTEAYNRVGILNILDQMIKDPKVADFSVLMFDIDKFKGINDSLGHLVGDKCLKTLSQIVKRNLREGDYFGRYGGDEFLILLPNTESHIAAGIAERFRQCVMKTDDPHFTVSFGLACYPMDGKTSKELIESADAGLYISKKNGRNRISRKQEAFF